MRLINCLLFLLLSTSAVADSPVLLIFGDSLSASYGIPQEAGWVALLERRMAQQGHDYRVINSSISGDTTQSGVTRLPAALNRHQPAIVIIELGGNDGLRGLQLAQSRANIEQMIGLVQQSGAHPLLAGVRLPPNFGPQFTHRFQQMFTDVAANRKIPHVTRILAGVAEHSELMQQDGIHPNEAGQPIVMENIWQGLAPLLQQLKVE